MAYIVLVDDDTSVLKPLTEQLESEGHKVSAFQSSLKASDFLKENDCDLAIFDIKMPELNGHQLLKEVRLKKPVLPIIFLSSKNEEQDELIGFTLGADDYITKPFSKHLLLARVTAVLRRHEVSIPTMPTRVVSSVHLHHCSVQPLFKGSGIP